MNGFDTIKYCLMVISASLWVVLINVTEDTVQGQFLKNVQLNSLIYLF